MAIPAGSLLVALSPGLVLFSFEVRARMEAQVGLSTAALFGTVLGLAAGATSLARDRRTGRLDLLLAGPLSPGELVLGKWIGIGAAIFLLVGILGGVHFLSLALRSGAPDGYGPLLVALFGAAGAGLLAAAIGLLLSARLAPAPAFLGGLAILVAGYVVPRISGDGAAIFAFLLPRSPDLNLAADAAFGQLAPAALAFTAIHGLGYAGAALAAAALLSRGKT